MTELSSRLIPINDGGGHEGCPQKKKEHTPTPLPSPPLSSPLRVSITSREDMSITDSRPQIPRIEFNSNKYDVSGIQKGIRGMADLACPSSEHTKKTVSDIVSTISAVINCQVDPNIDSKAAMNKVRNLLKEHGLRERKRKRSNGDDVTLLEEYRIGECASLIKPDEWEKRGARPDGFRQFVYFVCHCITQFAPKDCQPMRLVMPLRPLDQLLDDVRDGDDNSYDYDYLDDDPLVDIALVSKDPNSDWRECVKVGSDKKLSNPMLPFVDDIVGNVAIKTGYKVHEDLYMDQCNVVSTIASMQLNHRFTWGLVVLGSIVHINVFGPGIALASEDLDLATGFGRQEFIRLLVNWAYCDRERLGFDPSLSFCDDIDCWEIPFNTPADGQKTFYGYCGITEDTEIYGAHPVYLSAKVSKPLVPSQDCVPEEGDVTIKDYWPILPGEGDMDPCDEIRHLQCISRKLAGNDEFHGMYPVLLGYEDVKINGQLDTNREFLGEDIWRQLDDKTVVRVHKRVMIKGVYKPLSMSSCSAPEMIVVFNDVMRVYTEISRSCHILHRKINCSSIWVRRDERGIARGVLGDFNEAINVQEIPRVENDFMHLTPSLSIARLQSLERPPEELDDWESLLYTVCLTGIYTTKSIQMPLPKRDGRDRAIKGWSDGEFDIIGSDKRSDLGEDYRFEYAIISKFDGEVEGFEELQTLAWELRRLIFYNKKVEKKGRGYICDLNEAYTLPPNPGVVGGTLKSTNGVEYIDFPDPLMQRTNTDDVNDIRQDLLKCLDEYAHDALRLLDKDNST